MRFGISLETRTECVDFFSGIDEINHPDRLRAFVRIDGLELVWRCVDASTNVDFTMFFYKLVTTRRSPLEPALFDLLDALGRYFARKEDFRKQRCHELKEKIRKELLEADQQERSNEDFEQVVQRTMTSDI